MDYTHAELEAAFNLVANADDWRAPIRANLPLQGTDFELVRQAIVYFTATEPQFHYIDGIPLVGVEATGYRYGPAGP